jgi:hypothetical protein
MGMRLVQLRATQLTVMTLAVLVPSLFCTFFGAGVTWTLYAWYCERVIGWTCRPIWVSEPVPFEIAEELKWDGVLPG